MSNFGPDRAQSSDSALGWHVLDLETLPSLGKYYPADTVIKIISGAPGWRRHKNSI